MNIILRVVLIALVILHMVFLLGNVFAFFVLPFFTPWYISIPLMTFVINLATNKRWTCLLTDIENILRQKLGMRTISGFIGHYFKKPVWTLLKIKRTTKPLSPSKQVLDD